MRANFKKFGIHGILTVMLFTVMRMNRRCIRPIRKIFSFLGREIQESWIPVGAAQAQAQDDVYRRGPPVGSGGNLNFVHLRKAEIF